MLTVHISFPTSNFLSYLGSLALHRVQRTREGEVNVVLAKNPGSHVTILRLETSVSHDVEAIPDAVESSSLLGVRDVKVEVIKTLKASNLRARTRELVFSHSIGKSL